MKHGLSNVAQRPGVRETRQDMSNWRTSRREWLIGLAQASALGAATSETEPGRWTLREAAAAIRQKKISSEELTRLCLERSHREQTRLNAFITITDEEALKRAREMDLDLAKGQLRGPLHGVPVAFKDNIDTAGVRTTAAAELFRDRVPEQDAEVVLRIMDAGAVSLGKLNLDEFAFEGTGTTGCFGPVRNPWNVERITGGSSAGSGAALAAGLCFGSVGSDDGGSVRIPGAHCGVVGLKPTYGRVSTRGIVPSAYSLDCAGPMARTVEDAAVLLAVIAGNDPRDAITADRPVPDYQQAMRAPIAGLRVGVPRDYFFEGLHPDVAKSVEAAIANLRGRVKDVRDVTLPRFEFVEHGSYDVELYHYHRAMFEAHPDKYHPWSRRQMAELRAVTAVGYVETLKRIRECRRDVRRVWEQADVLVLPTMREPAPELKAVMEERHQRPPSNVSAFNRFGLPAMTVPCGRSSEGLPVGVQVVGRPWDEAAVLGVGIACFVNLR